jgi:predicted O-methyltransferase YrrM
MTHPILRAASHMLPAKSRNWVAQIVVGRPQIKAKAQEADQSTDVERWIDIEKVTPYVYSEQKRPEIAALLRAMQALQPRAVCEIGTSQGGTFFLFMRAALPTATLISIDIHSPLKRRLLLQAGRKQQQIITLLQADSHATRTAEKVRAQINGGLLDFLFIDGDHSYEGVKRDFELYSPLVRQGGIIAFHDIVPDYTTTKGITTRSKVGGVPAFWQELSQQYTTARFIEDEQQDGYGIGVIYW